MTRTALIAGRLLTATSPPRAAAARWGLRAIDATPVAGRWFRSGGLRTRPRLPVPSAERRGGEPLPNPRVRTRDGSVSRFDDILPAGWALLGLRTDPWPLIENGFPELSAALAARACHRLVICAPGGLAGVAEPSCPAVEDLDGSLLALWKRHPAAVALTRPDRFLAAVDEPSEVARAFIRLTGQLSTPFPARPYRRRR
jgi:3-(3-hydroxy-phenyl)propionate hydroxylase